MSIRNILGYAALALVCAAGTASGATTSAVADAAAKGDRAAVRTLIQQKADVNAAQTDGATALHWAVYRDDVETSHVFLLETSKFQLPPSKLLR